MRNEEVIQVLDDMKAKTDIINVFRWAYGLGFESGQRRILEEFESEIAIKKRRDSSEGQS